MLPHNATHQHNNFMLFLVAQPNGINFASLQNGQSVGGKSEKGCIHFENKLASPASEMKESGKTKEKQMKSKCFINSIVGNCFQHINVLCFDIKIQYFPSVTDFTALRIDI